jgi:hypothetical protein
MPGIRKLAALGALLLALAFAASAEAKSFKVKTNEGHSCQVTTIHAPTQYGLDVGSCTTGVQRVWATGYVYAGGMRELDARRWRPGPAPYRRTDGYTPPPTAKYVQIEFSILLKTKHSKRHPEMWRKKTGGADCRATPQRQRRDLLQCAVLERAGA